MKCLPLTFVAGVCALLLAHSAHAQLDVGATSEVTPFTLFDGTTLGNKSLVDFEGKVVVVNYYTPW